MLTVKSTSRLVLLWPARTPSRHTWSVAHTASNKPIRPTDQLERDPESKVGRHEWPARFRVWYASRQREIWKLRRDLSLYTYAVSNNINWIPCQLANGIEANIVVHTVLLIETRCKASRSTFHSWMSKPSIETTYSISYTRNLKRISRVKRPATSICGRHAPTACS